MSQRKDKGEKLTLSDPDPNAILKLLPLLEHSTSDNVDYVKGMIYENLSQCKDSRLISGILHYCITVNSFNALDTLINLPQESHEKHIFDKLSELIKSEKTRCISLQLLNRIVYKQPPWLYKITNHRLMNTILSMLKTDVCPANLMSGILIILCLLPLTRSEFSPYLPDTFAVFSRLAAWNIKKPSSVVDVFILHLQAVVYTLFLRLYGMFPCNFLAYLRAYYGSSANRDRSEDNHKVFTNVIRPFLDRVRLHPLLVTASKETELSPNRWKKMAYHDIIVDCASVSLDAIEGSYEVRNKGSEASTEQNPLSYEQFMSLSSQSSASVSFEPDTAVNEALGSTSEAMWTPSVACEVSTPPEIETAPIAAKNDREYSRYFSQISVEAPVDIAIEAKPDNLKASPESMPKHSSVQDSKSPSSSHPPKSMDFQEQEVVSSSQLTKPAVEAKEDDADREVSELTSAHRVDSTQEEEGRHDTPFCFTTQNLTGNKGQEDGEELFCSLPESDIVPYEAPPYARFRFISQCGPHPEIPVFNKPKVTRSVSCPAGLNPTDAQSCLPTTITTCVIQTNSVAITTTSSDICGGFIPTTSCATVVPPPHDSIIQVAPVSGSTPLTPPELLDRYIQSGHLANCSPQLSAIPITSSRDTDWTHFGGKAPEDEMWIVRQQALLLHIQLLFERHRRDVHSERNRRILGRAKKYRIQEEHIIALKEQVKLLEHDNEDLRQQLEKRTSSHSHYVTQKEQTEANLKDKIIKAEQENTNLSVSQKHLQALLVIQKQENNEITQEKEKCQSRLHALSEAADASAKEADRIRVLEQDTRFLSKQLILLQELLDHYRDREANEAERLNDEIGERMVESAAYKELEAFKKKYDENCLKLNISERKVLDLEKSIADMRSKQKDCFQEMDHLNILHDEEVKVLKERLRDLRKISEQKDFCILNLRKDIETIQNEKEELIKQKSKEAEVTEGASNCDTSPKTELESKSDTKRVGIS